MLRNGLSALRLFESFARDSNFEILCAGEPERGREVNRVGWALREKLDVRMEERVLLLLQDTPAFAYMVVDLFTHSDVSQRTGFLTVLLPYLGQESQNVLADPDCLALRLERCRFCPIQ